MESLPLSKCIPGQVYFCRYSVREKAELMIIIVGMNIFSAETCVISGYGVPEKVMSRRKRGEENEAKKMRAVIAGKMMAVIHTVIAAGNDEMTAHKEARFA